MITLYRAYGPDDELLYIGISGNVTKRAKQHRSSSPWCTAETRFVPGETFDDRTEALGAEAEAIYSEDPAHNTVHRPPRQKSTSSTTTAEWIAARLAEAPQQLTGEQAAVVRRAFRRDGVGQKTNA